MYVMKEIKAFIREDKLIEVAKNLKKSQYSCFSVFKGEGVGDYTDPDKEFPSLEFPFLHNKVVKIEIVCNTRQVSHIVNIIKMYARTGKKGDGLIYVSSVEDQIKIRD